MRNDSWTDSYREEMGDANPDRREGPEISPGVMSRGPVADEVDASLGAAPEPGTAGEDRAIARRNEAARRDGRAGAGGSEDERKGKG